MGGTIWVWPSKSYPFPTNDRRSSQSSQLALLSESFIFARLLVWGPCKNGRFGVTERSYDTLQGDFAGYCRPKQVSQIHGVVFEGGNVTFCLAVARNDDWPLTTDTVPSYPRLKSRGSIEADRMNVKNRPLAFGHYDPSSLEGTTNPEGRSGFAPKASWP